MKSVGITELSSIMPDVGMQGVSPSGGRGAGESFSSIMSGAAADGAVKAAMAGKNSDGGVEPPVRVTESRIDSEGRSAGSANENGRIRTKRTKDPDQKEMNDRITKAAGEVKDELKEKLGVTEEEIEAAMEVLGLSMADLLDPSAVTDLYTSLSGAGDAMSLITDEGLYGTLQDILSDLQTLTDSLKEELGITDEQLKEAVRVFDASEKPVFEAMDVSDSEETQIPGAEETSENSGAENRDSASKAAVDRAQESRPDGSDEGGGSGRRRSGHHRSESGDTSQGVQMTYQTTVTAQEIQVTQERTVSYSGTAQDREIMRQLVEQIRLNVGSGTTSLDMELNPASLGHVALNIEARNGAITATFTAQNEAVKTVIENQMIQLRENLESQGVRIEAVEVTVASHQFEENLDRGRQEREQEREADRAVRSAGRRMRINLLGAEGDGEEEELSEEEAINRDMMIRNGNSMDVTA